MIASRSVPDVAGYVFFGWFLMLGLGYLAGNSRGRQRGRDGLLLALLLGPLGVIFALFLPSSRFYEVRRRAKRLARTRR